MFPRLHLLHAKADGIGDFDAPGDGCGMQESGENEREKNHGFTPLPPRPIH
jgi:hypothetical protein